MNSICIKTNNTNTIKNLLNSFENIDLNDIYLSQNQFKNYKNIIIHYRGNSIDLFYSKLAEALSYTLINSCENTIIKRILNSNYFYFNNMEKEKIANICFSALEDEENLEFASRKNLLFVSFLKYIVYNKSMIFDGFINFRLKDYMCILDDAVDFSVNKFLIEKEYAEFIDLLKIYINSKESEVDTVHLIYQNQESILLNEDKEIINTKSSIFEAKYLSDISFSSNDYALNTLLTLIPNNLYIHLLDTEDEFITTLKLIFANRIHICNDCTICQAYKLNNKHQLKIPTMHKK